MPKTAELVRRRFEELTERDRLTEYVSARVTKQTHERILALAKKQNLTSSAIVNALIVAALDALQERPE